MRLSETVKDACFWMVALIVFTSGIYAIYKRLKFLTDNTKSYSYEEQNRESVEFERMAAGLQAKELGIKF